MPFNGSGGFIPLSPPDYPAVPGTTVAASQHNNNLSDIFTGLGNCVTRDGQSSMNADLDFNGFKITGAAAATTNGQFVVWGQQTTTLGDVTLTTTTSLPLLTLNKASGASKWNLYSDGTAKNWFRGQIVFGNSTPSFSATPTFDFADTGVIRMATMTANVTNASVSNLDDGATGTVWVIQDGTGGRTFASSTIKLTGVPGQLANQRSRLDITNVGGTYYASWTAFPV